MKTTLDLDDELLDRARQLAAQRGTTLRALIEDSLRARLHLRPAPAGRFRLDFPVVEDAEAPHVDIADRGRLYDAMNNE
jgi:hypothetical protein